VSFSLPVNAATPHAATLTERYELT